MPDTNELRLRENVRDNDGCLQDVAFVVGGEISANGKEWLGGRFVCGFGEPSPGVYEYEYGEPGEPPSPEDARRIEVAWNMHDKFVRLCEKLVLATDEDMWDASDIAVIGGDAEILLDKVKSAGKGEG